MRESLAIARPTLVCDGLNGVEKMEGEVRGGKGISMEMLHKRLGHTSQGGMERLVREHLVTRLEEGMKGDFGMRRGCKMGISSEKAHPQKDPKFYAMALANRRSGESAKQDMDRGMYMYYRKKGHYFSFMEEYQILSVNHKWMLDVAATNEHAARRARIAEQTPVRARVEMVAKASPTSANTRNTRV